MSTFLTIISILLGIVILFQMIIINRKNSSIEKVNHTLIDIVQGNKNRRLHLPSLENNLTELTTLINQLLDDWVLSTEKAQRLENERKQMITNISHDLRTPLTSILGYLEALQQDKELSNEEKKNYLQVVFKKGKDMQIIINDFFELVRLEAEDGLQQSRPVLLNKLVKEEIVGLYHQFVEVGIQPNIDLPKEDIFVLGDEQSLRRVISNLLINAIHYGHEGKEIGIKLISQNDRILLMVWDRGKGIAEENIPYIFERLFTGEHSRNLKLQGTGLGLTIVKKLLEKHRGSIKVESKPFEKTIFTCNLPLYKEN